MVSHSQLMVKAALLRQVVTSAEEEIHAGHWRAAAAGVDRLLELARELDYDLRTVNRVRKALDQQEK